MQEFICTTVMQVFTNKEEIAIGVKQELTKSMTGFGYAIIQASMPLFGHVAWTSVADVQLCCCMSILWSNIVVRSPLHLDGFWTVSGQCLTRITSSLQALVTDIVPDSKVRAAMNDINASQRLRYSLSTSSSLRGCWQSLCSSSRRAPLQNMLKPSCMTSCRLRGGHARIRPLF